jgi:hypothetical protein
MTRVFDFPFRIVLRLLSRGFYVKTMSFANANNLSILSFEPKLQLYLQINNSIKFKQCCARKWDFQKTSNSKTKKVNMCSTFETWRIPNNYPNVDGTFFFFHFFAIVGVWTCNLHQCVVPLY